MTASTTKELLQRTTARIAHKYVAGEKQLFLVRGYEGTQGEFLHYHALMQDDIQTSFLMEVDKTTLELFPVESLVWVYIDNGGTRIQEATCLDEVAAVGYELARQKMRRLKDEDVAKLDGQFRLAPFRKDWN